MNERQRVRDLLQCLDTNDLILERLHRIVEDERAGVEVSVAASGGGEPYAVNEAWEADALLQSFAILRDRILERLKALGYVPPAAPLAERPRAG